MTEAGQNLSWGVGPGNKRIAATLLESLAVRGRHAQRERAARALGLADTGFSEAGDWLPDDAIRGMCVAAELDPSFTRSIGHRLVAPDAFGLPLYGLGLATPEKAYRRAQSLLPRESASASWRTDRVSSGAASLSYRAKERVVGDIATPSGASLARTEAALCAMRRGMLESIPTLYGLLPAQVRETECLARGDDACRYQVEWSRVARGGAILGAVIGGVCGAGALAVSWLLGVTPLGGIAAISLLVTALGSIGGLAIDGWRQLAAVAGARRGHLALFDQVDDALASKLDALARANAKLEHGEASFRTRINADGPWDGEGDRDGESGQGGEAALSPRVRSEIQSAAQAIHAAAGDLECWFEKPENDAHASDAGAEGIGTQRGWVREIREWAARIGSKASPDGEAPPRVVDLSNLVAHAIAGVRPSLPRSAVIELDAEQDLLPVRCEPVQIEQAVAHLVRNAVEASVGLSESPRVFVRVRNVGQGVEVAVEDRGVGIESTAVDEVFDPFFDEEQRRDGRSGFGLPACLQIVERHGGEMRIEAEDRAGTCVAIVLPASIESD